MGPGRKGRSEVPFQRDGCFALAGDGLALGIQALTWKPLEQSLRSFSLGMEAIRLHSLEPALGQLKLPASWGAQDSDPSVITLCSYTRVQASDDPWVTDCGEAGYESDHC